MKIYRILSEEDAAKVLTLVQANEWKEGRARTEALTGTVKQNQEILGKEVPELADGIGRKIIGQLDVQLDAIPLALRRPKFSRYADGAQYHKHTDAPWMGSVRTDLACTLFLSDPDTYTGGNLFINGRSAPFKLKPGEAVIYDCGSPHFVEPVTEGERICAITWIQSRVRDPRKRALITELRALLADIEPVSANKGEPMQDTYQDWFLRGGRVHSALLRMWSET